jgi:Zn-dependent peptidase ImmA (M78 family)
VPVEDIVARLGIPIRYVNLPQFFTSALVSEDGMPVMIVNWAKSDLERRTALAHMLGHILILMAGDEQYPRDNADHRDADMVARELVLPTSMVIEQARLWFNDYRYLARLFGVTEAAMLERMRDMGLIKGPDGLMWDY